MCFLISTQKGNKFSRLENNQKKSRRHNKGDQWMRPKADLFEEWESKPIKEWRKCNHRHPKKPFLELWDSELQMFSLFSYFLLSLLTPTASWFLLFPYIFLMLLLLAKNESWRRTETTVLFFSRSIKKRNY